jgi:hypothetical protein
MRNVCFFNCESICLSQLGLTDHSQAAFTEQGVAQTFHVSREVTVLGISLFVTGLGAGPLLVGPLSEVYGTF